MANAPAHLRKFEFGPTRSDSAAQQSAVTGCDADGPSVAATPFHSGELSPFQQSLRAKVAAKSEYGAQVMLLNEVRRRGVKLLRWFAVPNAARRSRNLAAKMKAEGLRSGVADLVFVAPPNRVFFLEMKKEGGGVRSDAQLLFAREMHETGAPHEFADGFAEAVAILERWGLLV